jgi:hypothetical protein
MNKKYPKIPVIINKDYKVELEPHAGVYWLHCDVFKFTPTAYRNMEQSWKEYTEYLTTDVYALHDSSTNKPSKHFMEKFGFKYLKNLDNKPYEIWKWSK